MFFAQVSVRDHSQDLELPPCQFAVPRERCPPVRLAQRTDVREQPMGDLGRAITSTRDDVVDCPAKVVEGVVVQNAAIRARLKAQFDQVRCG